MNIEKFAKVAESLRQYRRAELKDFEAEIGTKPIDQLYVDPLPGNAILNSVLSGNTTFLLGRKGTGKSTVFAKAQSIIRQKKDVISIYIDVKSLYDILASNDIEDIDVTGYGISLGTYRAHMLRKVLLGNLIAELLKEIGTVCDNMSLLDRWLGSKRQYDELKTSMKNIATQVKNAKLETHEIPILQKITRQLRVKRQQEKSITNTSKDNVGIKVSNKGVEAAIGGDDSTSDFDKTLDDNDVYNEYSDIVIRSFPFNEILFEIKTILAESGLTRLVIFFDDFSELKLLDQRLFVDVILSPLNNSSNESVKLKVAGYPGRVYYGRIDPGKTDTIPLDFSALYEAAEVQEMERSATDYTSRLLAARFKAFGLTLADYFETSSSVNVDDHMNMMFKASFNVPRIMGHLLHQCYLDRVSKGQKITVASIRLAARKYFENTVLKYFEKMNRFALEPFENKLDRHNQKQILDHLLKEARGIRKKIIDGDVGGRYFSGLTNPPTSHFIVKPELEDVFSSLESNFFVSRYKNTRDKEGQPVIVYAFFMGMTETERMSWGFPDGREFRNYFVQRCFDYTRAVYEYLSLSQTIKCADCSQCFPMDSKDSIALYKWRCPECGDGTCSVVNLSDNFKHEVELLDKGIMLEPIELEIVSTINDEGREMRAGEIAALLDTTHQLIGRRTGKLKDMGLVNKARDDEGVMQNSITERCERTYFE
ncbi:transcriptional regulator [Herbaspirillum lusitanum]|uniref:MarR family transcriptional regulator n=1 Tax=Herbaspirillum lusitanum TaxID=213312 RepID=UPI002238C107|nr:MarR family transcriptional regulator [Herbaspirillum lusitanum]MCW5297442.1 transcriptional regulator [Herbaspirillum lusitanum]